MTATIKFTKTVSKTETTYVAPIYSDMKLGSHLSKINKDNNNIVSDYLARKNGFKAECCTTKIIYLSGKDTKPQTLILLGMGDAKDISALKSETAGGKLLKALKAEKIQTAIFLGDDLKKNKSLTIHDCAAHIANGVLLASYNYDIYKEKDKNARPFKSLSVVTDVSANAKSSFAALNHIAQGTFLARDLVNTPPNDLYPDAYAKLIRKELKPLGVDVEIIDDKKLLKMGAGAISAVGQGSERLPRMVIMKWNGKTSSKSKTKKSNAPDIALVGKGVTFDTGGISLKPGAGMDEMKMDMGGSAAVVGAMKALALSKAKVNVIGAVGLAENMPSHNAYRPGDVITSLSGKTIEVLNTDAEGRLVLADVLTHMQDTYTPNRIIDLATLTGAMMVALGHEYCGTFVNDDTLWNGLETASTNTGEKLWRMPLDKAWSKSMEGEFGDVQNMSKMGRLAGACTAAGFLQHFINDGVAWAHMDIAGTAWVKKDQPTTPKYGTGFGVRVLCDMIMNGQYGQ